MCRTRAECAAKSCVVSRLLNTGTNAATLELFNNAGGSVCLLDLVPSDEIVRCLVGDTLNAAAAFAVRLIIITDRTACLNRNLPEFVVSAPEPASDAFPLISPCPSSVFDSVIVGNVVIVSDGRP